MTKPPKQRTAKIRATAGVLLLAAAVPQYVLAEQSGSKAPVAPTILSLVVLAVGGLLAWWHKNKNKRK